ncbi:MAG TPA: PhzF family phenazine biosynthesis protein [Bryobacteraceae bacterium]|nr:PhzF family phenazine biosynthesis protein [Bryobacteraceae bacterium]
MTTRISQVDAFTTRCFSGNPAAVCVLDKPAEEAWMQNVAAEMNLSETAFLVPCPGGYSLRWFTPAVEVDLCGHATLAAAHVLWEEHRLAAGEQARFHTRSGLLLAEKEGAWIELDFPATPAEPVPAPDGLERALGTGVVYTGRSAFDLLVELESPEILRNLKPDMAALAQLPVRGVIVTSRSDEPEHDFLSRFFAPASGIDEDPVTGSAHCALAPYWGAKLGKTAMTAYQASKRGGIVRARLQNHRVILAGQAVTVLRADLLA